MRPRAEVGTHDITHEQGTLDWYGLFQTHDLIKPIIILKL